MAMKEFSTFFKAPGASPWAGLVSYPGHLWLSYPLCKGQSTDCVSVFSVILSSHTFPCITSIFIYRVLLILFQWFILMAFQFVMVILCQAVWELRSLYVHIYLFLFCTRSYRIWMIFKRSIWCTEMTLRGTLTPSQSRPGSNDNEGVFHTLQSSTTGALPSEAV